MTLFFIRAIVVMQWNLVLGVAGIFSLAQMALPAVGTYATAMLAYYFAIPAVVAMPAAALVTIFASLIIGAACLRLRGPYVAHHNVGFGLAVLAVMFSFAIIRGPLGLAFKALRDNPGYAMSRGISKFKYQIWVFGLSAFFTSLAGTFYAAQFGVVGPILFLIPMLLYLLSMIVVGSMRTI